MALKYQLDVGFVCIKYHAQNILMDMVVSLKHEIFKNNYLKTCL